MQSCYSNMQICDLKLAKEKIEELDKANITKDVIRKPKLRLYNQISGTEGAELYVKLNLANSERSILAQLKMGILPLRIETGRICNLKSDERFCQICKSGEVEDEIHFLFKCKQYQQTRDVYMVRFAEKIEAFNTLNDTTKLQLLYKETPRQLCKYLGTIFQERKAYEYN